MRSERGWAGAGTLAAGIPAGRAAAGGRVAERDKGVLSRRQGGAANAVASVHPAPAALDAPKALVSCGIGSLRFIRETGTPANAYAAANLAAAAGF